MRIAELERLAREATPGPWHVLNDGWIADKAHNPLAHMYSTRKPGHFRVNAAYIAACSPEVVLRLCEVVKQLDALKAKPVWEHIEAEDDCAALRAALAAMESTEKNDGR